MNIPKNTPSADPDKKTSQAPASASPSNQPRR